jgi:hypothetical protein
MYTVQWVMILHLPLLFLFNRFGIVKNLFDDWYARLLARAAQDSKVPDSHKVFR